MTSTSSLERMEKSSQILTRDLTRRKNSYLSIHTGGDGKYSLMDNNDMITKHSETIFELEQKMVPVKRAMEGRGLNVDLKALSDLITKTTHEKSIIDAELKDVFGVKGECNFNSSRDVSKILLDNMGIKPRVTQTGRLSTNRRMLRDISNPVTDKIVRFRELEKLLSALKAILDATNTRLSKIYCRYLDNCPSGRLYTQGYSFQSIPEAARSVIIADTGCSFLLVDYDSFELRILSALSHDTYFKDCWAKGLDLHRKVVADMKGIPYDSVTDKERKLGKILGFGMAYGQEPPGLARNLHIKPYEAQKLMADYKSHIPEIEAFKIKVIENARTTGIASTYYGRRRWLPHILSLDFIERKKAERQAVNHAIQGCAADIVKFALVRLHEEGFAISTTVHDSVLLTIPDDKIEQSISRVRVIMEIELEGLKLPVTCRTGKTWGECK